MMGSSKLALVGAFVIGGIVLFAVGIFMIGDRRLLFTDDFEVAADFGNVTGVQIGSKVRVAGFDAGEVTDIVIPPRPSIQFRVRMRIREDLHPLVRGDSVAAILTDGLIGSVFIQIREGTDATPPVPEGGTITGVDPIEIADLIEEGRRTFQAVAREVLDLKAEISATVNSFDETLDTTNLLLADVGNDVRAITSTTALFVDDARGIASTTKSLVADLQAGRGTVGKLLISDDLYNHAVGVSRDAEATMKAIREAATRARNVFTDLTKPDGPSQRVFTDIREVLGHARDAMSDLAENTEALKHNWLFRGFFADRGFFNLDAMTVEEYRRLARQGRYTPLRIWLDASRLFATMPEGDETLTPEGRTRLNSAMAQLIQYPRDSPLVIEGYSTAATADQRFVEAQVRGRLVRDYLVARFSRSANLTGSIPIGAEANGSPTTDGRWNGVALTLFVRPEALKGTNADH
jgi:phospholipid/cholesterol/gamma-HCH transport system substrate-binding protein